MNLEVNIKDNIEAINRWFIENGILNDHVINNLIVYVMSCDERIRDANIFISADRASVGVLVYLSRWSMFFHSKRIYAELREALMHYLFRYHVDVSFAIYSKNGIKNGSRSKKARSSKGGEKDSEATKEAGATSR